MGKISGKSVKRGWLGLAGGSVFMFVLTALSIMTGCGGGHRGDSSLPTSPSVGVELNKAGFPVARVIQPRIVSASEADPDLPGDDSSALVQDSVAEGDTFRFNKVVDLAENGRAAAQLKRLQPFLVWSMTLPGAPTIQDAYYVHERRDLDYRRTGDYQSIRARLDEKTGRWFIPIQKALESLPQNLDPTELHWLRLELHLPNLPMVHVRVGLQVRGSLPQIDVSRFDVTPQMTRLISMPSGEKGWVLAWEKYHNSSLRPVTLWFKLNRSQAHLTQGLRHEASCDDLGFNGGPQGGHLLKGAYQIHAQMELRAIRITRPGADFTQGLADSEWAHLELASGESVDIQWLGAPSPGIAHCQVPGNTVRDMGFRDAIRYLINEDVSNLFRQFQVRDWYGVSGVRVDTAFHRNVRVTDTALTGIADSARSAEALVDNGETQTLHFGQPIQPQWGPWGCQGVLGF